MSDSSPPYDLRNPEEMFHCIDVLTRARAALSANDPKLAGEIGKLTEALMELFNPDGTEAEPIAEPPPSRPAVRPGPQTTSRQSMRQPARPPTRHESPVPTAESPQGSRKADRFADFEPADLIDRPPKRHGSPVSAAESPQGSRKADRFGDFEPADLIGGPPIRRSRRMQTTQEEQPSEENSDEIVDVLTGEKIRLRDK